MELFTLDINFDNLENLNSSIEKTRIILNEFKKSCKIIGYYLMRYINKKFILGIKIISEDFLKKDKTLEKIKDEIKNIKGYKNIEQENPEGQATNTHLMCSISMEFRNQIKDLLNRKPTDKEFINIIHHLTNPLLLNYKDELRILKQQKKYIEEILK